MSIKKLNEVSYNSVYQQDPKPDTQLMIYTGWTRILQFPDDLIELPSWGLDFGKTTGINALVKCGMVGEKDAYVEEKLYSPGIPVSVIVDVLKSSGYHRDQIVWCDHIPTKIAELQRAGITALPAVKGPGSVSAGIDKLKEFNVHYIGDNMHMEYTSYQKVTYGELITNIPVDENNHLMDASRYGLLSRFFRGR
jgi:phage terminase large subunit